MIDAALLKGLCPTSDEVVRDQLATAFDLIFPAFLIDTPMRQAHALAQAGIETAYFRTLREYGGSQTRYAPYYGRGPIQLTWQSGYADMGKRLSMPLVDRPDLVADPALGTVIFCMYWQDHNLNRWADADDAKAVSRAINRGSATAADPANAEDERVALTERAKGLLGVEPAAATGMTLAQAQAALNHLGCQPPLQVDGKTGPKTRKALWTYQSEHGLEPTGALDAATIKDITSRLIGS